MNDWTVDVLALGFLLYTSGIENNRENRKIAGLIVIGTACIMRLLICIFGR